MRSALPDYFGKVIVKFSAQNSTGMWCGKQSSGAFRCQAFSFVVLIRRLVDFLIITPVRRPCQYFGFHSLYAWGQIHLCARYCTKFEGSDGLLCIYSGLDAQTLAQLCVREGGSGGNVRKGEWRVRERGSCSCLLGLM